ncbi:MAG: hypothetical protein JWL61_5419 [Gemmatimonadetes bacterium]|nr:hypothetical protein [Gemmatimonadota bacterium]
MGFLSGLGKYVGPGLTAATTVAGAYNDATAAAKRNELTAQLRERDTKEQLRQQHVREAIFARKEGYVPTAERGLDERTVLGGEAINGIVGAATAGMPGSGIMSVGHPDAKEPRYGEDVGGYSYDKESSPAQKDAAEVGGVRALIAQRIAQSKRAQAMIPSIAMRQKLIDAGNDPDDVDAAIATGDPAAVRGLLRPARDPIADFRAKHDYSVTHPLPSRTSSANSETPQHRDARQNATAVRQQLSATHEALSSAQRTVPKQPAFFSSPADSSDFVHRRTSAQKHVAELRQRSDSLTSVLDRETARMQGGSVPDSAPAGENADAHALNAELESNQQRYERLLRAGADTSEAKEALAKTNQLTRQKYARRTQ